MSKRRDAGGLSVFATVEPLITGTFTPGQTLTVSDGTWEDDGGTITGFTYQWFIDGVAIAGATGNTYTVQPGDEGSIYAIVTAQPSGATAQSNSLTADLGIGSMAIGSTFIVR